MNIALNSFAADPRCQWTEWNHIPHVERWEKRFLPDCCKGSRTATVLCVQTCHSHVWWEKLRRQISTGGDFTAPRV